MKQFTVTEAAMRPASTERRCFYCHVDVGGKHKDDCVLINKTVKVRMIVEYDIEVPAHWDKERIEFHRNDGTWCSTNAINELNNLVGDGDCLCGRTYFEYVEDAGGLYSKEH